MAIKGIAGGWNRYLFFAKESAWSTPVTSDVYIPVDSYDVKAEQEFYNANRFTGVWQRKSDNEISRIGVRGTLTCDLMAYQINSGSLKSIAQHLVELATDSPADEDLSSGSFTWFDPNEGTGNSAKLHDGMRCNTMTISGDESGPVKLSMGFEGAEEAAVAEVALPDNTRRRAMMGRDTILQFGGVNADVKSWGMTLTNGLIVRHIKSLFPSGIYAGPRNVDLVFAIDKLSAVYDVLRRGSAVTDRTAQIVCKGDNDGTSSTNTVMTIDFDLTQFGGATDGLSRDDLESQDVSYAVIKPDTSSNDIDITWSVT